MAAKAFMALSPLDGLDHRAVPLFDLYGGAGSTPNRFRNLYATSFQVEESCALNDPLVGYEPVRTTDKLNRGITQCQ